MAEADPAITTAQRSESAEIAINERPLRAGQLGRRLLMFIVPFAVAIAGLYGWYTSGRSVSTDNAYVKRDIASLSSDVSGRIIEVRVRENQIVKKGDVLFVVDPAPYKVALEQANAQIASAQVDVGKLRKDYQSKSVDIEGARSDVYYDEQDLKRQQALMAQGFTTLARLQQSQQTLESARKTLNQALADQATARAALATGAQVPGVNPQVALAQAQRDQAALNLERTIVRAPISGRVSQTDRLQVGQMAVTGLPMVSIVASDKSWVTANFKETDLTHMRPGQRATVTLDAYPSLKLHGHVQSIGAGTDSQFSVLPAQNANGNWVKVSQRVPVRIAIDGTPERPMIAGLSAKVTVDVRDQTAADASAEAKAR